jgi:hypothetical protein
LCLLFFFIPLSASSENFEIKSWVNKETKKSLYSNSNQLNLSNDKVGFSVLKTFNNIASNITMNLHQKQQLTFDQSFIEYKNKNTRYGIGKINRNWSFSPNTSLILSSNAPPATSIYFFTDNNDTKNFLFSWAGLWSFEAFNSIQNNSDNTNDAMMFGMRAVIEPLNNFKFELVKTSQWGGEGYKKNLSAFKAAFIGNTNESKYSNINQMAGFGLSYLLNKKQLPTRIYAQFIGEDEAGNLPSCYISLVGNELAFPSSNFFTTLGFEYVDTRIDTSTHGNCGPNTAYNNNIYDYTNYGSSLAAPIDSEGKSYEIWVLTKLSEKADIKYSIKNLTINDTNWSYHRLNDHKQKSWIGNIEASLKLESLKINGRLTYQGLSLNKVNMKDGFSLNLNTEYEF